MNELTIAVAGGRKTQGIVDACVAANDARRILVLAFTQASQNELEQRIRRAEPFNPRIEVLGWYAFLLRHFVRPYLPLFLPGIRLAGFNYEGDPGRYASGAARFVDASGRAYQKHLASLAHKVHEASNGSVVDRLEHIYTDIYIDEAQDIGGWSLEIVDVLFASRIRVQMVGDIRQALLSTDPRDQKNPQYKFDKVINWYRKRQASGFLTIIEKTETFRSSQQIAALYDKVFDPSLGYLPTLSLMTEASSHSGMFRLSRPHVSAYVRSFSPLCLHWRSDFGAELGLPFRTFGVAKGATVNHVLILPTAAMKKFLKTGQHLEGRAACSLYIGLTRAVHSVAFILDDEDEADGLLDWSPVKT